MVRWFLFQNERTYLIVRSIFIDNLRVGGGGNFLECLLGGPNLLLKEHGKRVLAELLTLPEGIHARSGGGHAPSPLHLWRDVDGLLEDSDGRRTHLLSVWRTADSKSGKDLPLHLARNLVPEARPARLVEGRPAVDVDLDVAGHPKVPDGDGVDDDVAVDEILEDVVDVVLQCALAGLVAGRAVLAGGVLLLGKNDLLDFDGDALLCGGLGDTVAVIGEHLVGSSVSVGASENSEYLNYRHW